MRLAIAVVGALALAALAAAGTPDEAEPTRSAEGRRIPLMTLGSDDAVARVLVVGSIHGDEPGGLAVTRRLRRRPPPSGVELWIIDTLNPDGLVRGTRQNARGVDLNRNFPLRWRPQGQPGSTFHSGRRPLSEPESRFAATLIGALQPHVTVWFHQPFGLVDLQAGADRRLVRRYARAAGLPARRLRGAFPGSAARWQNATFAGSAFVVELPAGPVSAGVASRHVRAVRAVASRAACVSVDRCR